MKLKKPGRVLRMLYTNPNKPESETQWKFCILPDTIETLIKYKLIKDAENIDFA